MAGQNRWLAVSEMGHTNTALKKEAVARSLQVIDMPSPMVQEWQLTCSVCDNLVLPIDQQRILSPNHSPPVID